MYLRWKDQTEAEKEGQITGFSTISGDAGYLREAYHGGPYVTQWLMPECWHLGEEDGVKATNERMHALVGGLSAMFDKATAENPSISYEGASAEIADEIPDYPPEGYMVEVEEVSDPDYPDDGPAGARIPAEVLELRLPICQIVHEQRSKRVYGEDPNPRAWKAFVDFVALARNLEDAGRKPWIYVSY